MAIPFSHLISDSGIVTVFVAGKPYVFAQDYPQMDKVKKAINEKNTDEIVRLGNLPKAIETYSGNNVKVEHGVVLYKSKPIHNSLTRRILKMMNDGYEITSMLKFLDNLMQNPSKHAVDELYNFLVHRNLPITENGCFLAYKAVREDYMDWHSNTVRNQVGDTPPLLERNEVDDDWRLECSSGYHVGAIEYVNSFHSGADEKSHIMIVEVNPKDVVSVPTDERFTKCRTMFYTVVGEMAGELMAQVYKTTPSSFAPSTPMAAAPVGPLAGSMSSMNSDDGYPHHDEDDEDDEDEDEDFDDDDDDDDDDDEEGFGPSEP